MPGLTSSSLVMSFPSAVGNREVLPTPATFGWGRCTAIRVLGSPW